MAPQRTTRIDTAATAGRDFVGAARRLGEILAGEAVRVDGSAAWIGIRPVDHEHGNLGVVAVDLYGGTTGIALFLAALARVTGDARFRGLAIAAVAPALRLRNEDGGAARAVRRLGIGGGGGIGSIVYGLVRIAGLLDEPRLLADASTFSRLIDDERIAHDMAFDVMSGCAGAILALLSLHRADGDAATLTRAVACGHHIVRSQIVERSAAGGRLPLASGFSHGAAGMALALLRLHHIAGDDAFRDAARELLLFERGLFQPESGDWAILPRDKGGPASPCRWCYGASGIGLARLGCAEWRNETEMTGEIDAALAATQAAAPLPMDHLCCGNFGRLDFLLTAGLRLDRPSLVGLARAGAADRIGSAFAQGGFPWRHGDDALNPTLFQGIAGIGYEMLRLAAPDLLPSILLWDG
jgi:lantibiotic modifying enzyme